MRAVVLALVFAAIAPLSGCASYFESLYDEEARANCDNARRSAGGENCYDRVERERRERRRNSGGED